MKKRLRKKYHLGEFQELGFEITMELAEGFDDKKLDLFVTAFVEDVLDKNGLDFEGGGNTSELFGFVVLNKRGSVTAEHRTNVEAWVKDNAEVTKATVGELMDAWYA